MTGSNAGVGKELARILYAKHAKVYIAARSAEKAASAISSIKASSPSSKGSLIFLKLDLADLTTIKASADEFLSKESKLHVLFNNAGVMRPPRGSVTAQGYELQLGVNNIGTFMFTKLLTPTLAQTAASEPKGSVRVVWVSSIGAELMSPSGGVPIDELDNYQHEKKWEFYLYGISKAGNYLHAAEFARRHGDEGIVSVPLHPGNLDSELYRTINPMLSAVLRRVVLWPSVYGAYTELFGGLSPEVTMEKSGSWGKSQCNTVFVGVVLTLMFQLCLGAGSWTSGRTWQMPRRARPRAELASGRDSGSGRRSRSSRICDVCGRTMRRSGAYLSIVSRISRTLSVCYIVLVHSTVN